ncbi:MAG TPA: methyltransferase domain-containing protein [Chloroflexota bacterium]|nr:methyltransferase domain-containing protein [Chloroflexota bacterium]
MTVAPTTLQIQSRLAGAENYNRWIYSQIAPYIGQRILDVGCAIGNITQFYVDREKIIGLDVVQEELEVASQRFAGKNFEAHRVDVSSPLLLQFKDERLDTAVCLNVLEHVENDVHALVNMRDVLMPGGHICLLVPVNPWLFGPMDAIDHHFRRYTRRELNAKLAEARLEVVHQRYFNLLGIPAWLFTNRVLRRSMAAPVQYSLYDSIVPVLSAIERALPPPAGLSLVTVCRTPQ